MAAIKKTTATKPKKRKKGSGGAREGAGRPRKENPRTQHITIIGTPLTLARVKQLREFMKDDDPTFNTAFEQWVAEMAQDYGIE